MHGLASSELTDLLAATEAIGDDDGHGSCGPDSRQQTVFGNLFGNLELVRLKSKRAGHAAAAGLDGFDRGAGLAQQGYFTGWSAEDRFVVAVAMKQNLRSGKSTGPELRSLGGEKVG